MRTSRQDLLGMKAITESINNIFHEFKTEENVRYVHLLAFPGDKWEWQEVLPESYRASKGKDTDMCKSKISFPRRK